MKKRMLSIILAVVMTAFMLPTLMLTAFANETVPLGKQESEQPATEIANIPDEKQIAG